MHIFFTHPLEEKPNENGFPTNTESEDEPLEIISDDNISVITNGDTKKEIVYIELDVLDESVIKKDPKEKSCEIKPKIDSNKESNDKDSSNNDAKEDIIGETSATFIDIFEKGTKTAETKENPPSISKTNNVVTIPITKQNILLF